MNLMPTKKLEYGKNARAKFQSGVNQLADAVAVTLGPKGRHVAIETDNGYFRVTKDGVTVAREITLEDPFENGGAQIVLEAAQKTAEEAGDGTTTATILAQAIYNIGIKEIDEKGTNPVLMKRGMDTAANLMINAIKGAARKVETIDDIQNIAAISANGETAISSLVVEAINKVGRDGHIIVDVSPSADGVKTIEGMRYTGVGLHSMMMVTDMEKMQVVFDKARILIWPKAITSFAQLMPLLNRLKGKNEPLVIVCDDITGEALSGVVANVVRGLQVAAVRCPGMGDAKTAMLEDLAVAFGAKVCIEEVVKLTNVSDEMLGYCDKFTAGQYDYCFVGTKVPASTIKARLDQLEAMKNDPNCPHEHIRGQLQARINKLAGRIAVIGVSADSFVEANEKKDRVDDALCATRAAIDEGFLPGAGVFLYNMSHSLATPGFTNKEEEIGFRIVMEACAEPFRRILKNGGFNPSDIDSKIAVAVRKTEDASNLQTYGYNLYTGEVCDLIKSGIIDPAKVTRCALQNAVSVAGTMLTCECVITKRIGQMPPTIMADPYAPQPMAMPPIPSR